MTEKCIQHDYSLLVKDGEKYYKCLLCGHVVRSRNGIKQHLMKNHPETAQKNEPDADKQSEYIQKILESRKERFGIMCKPPESVPEEQKESELETSLMLENQYLRRTIEDLQERNRLLVSDIRQVEQLRSLERTFFNLQLLKLRREHQ